jgi:hypothetical protein
LPPGINIDPITGIVSGTPTGTKSASYALLRVKDSDGETATMVINTGRIYPGLVYSGTYEITNRDGGDELIVGQLIEDI